MQAWIWILLGLFVILTPDPNPLHMDPDPQVDLYPNANSTFTCGRGSKSQHYYIQLGQNGSI